MSTASINYAAAVTMTHTLASLANSTAAAGVGRQSTAVDNTANLYVDCHVGGKIVTGTTTANTLIEVLAFASYDGTSYSGGAGATDAGLTLIPVNRFLLKVLSYIFVPDTTARTYTWGPLSVAQVYGGVLPQKWGVFVLNSSGAALSASGHETKYTGIKWTSA
jgi:hypothetical protein